MSACVLRTETAASPNESATGIVQLASARGQSAVAKQACAEPVPATGTWSSCCPFRHPSVGGKRPRSGVALTQHFPDFSNGENVQEAPNARTNLKFGQFVFVKPCHAVDRHLRFPGEELDGGSLMEQLAMLGVHSDIPS
jgi:hypothetical protein